MNKKTISFIFLLSILALITSTRTASAEASAVKTTEDSIKDVAKKYENTVVQIETHIKYSSGLETGFIGSGLFLDKNGYVLTNAHMVYDEDDLKKDLNIGDDEQGADMFDIFFGASKKDKAYYYWVIYKNRKYPAKFIGSNPYGDCALLKIDPKKLKDAFVPAVIGDSDKLQIGETVIAIGNPLGLTNTVTKGIVSSMHRRAEDRDLWFTEDFIQTDAPINPGNSGGPLINLRGEVIGLNDASINGADGLHFAVPINLVKESVSRMYKEGRIKCGWFGVRVLNKNFVRTGEFSDMQKLNELTDIEDREALLEIANITEENSAVVIFVNEKSPAANAGLQRGDIIVEFEGKPIKEGFDFRIELTKTKADQTVKLKIIRVEEGKKKEMTLKAKLGDQSKLLQKLD